MTPQELDEAQRLAERQVLRWLVTNRGLPETMPLLNASAFYDPTHQQLFERLHELAMHQARPAEWAELEAAVMALPATADEATGACDLSHALEQMDLASSVRLLEAAWKDFRSNVRSLDDAEEHLFGLEGAIVRAAYRERWILVRSGRDALGSAVDDVFTARDTATTRALTSGFPALDQYLPPLVQPSILVLAGSTGSELWKLASCLLDRWAVEQNRVVYCRLMGTTGEADIMVNLYLKHESLSAWLRRELPAESEDELTGLATRLVASPILFNANPSRDLEVYRKELYPLRKYTSAQITILDGLHPGDADNVDVAAFTAALHGACKDLELLQVVLIEGVGSASPKDPLSALGAWRPLGEAARAVLILDTDYTQPPVEDLSQQSVIIARNTGGPVGRVTLGPQEKAGPLDATKHTGQTKGD